jgi:NAD(P)-dependent dehydrogenase (short-subunit alcohol dehydrogenase family)
MVLLKGDVMAAEQKVVVIRVNSGMGLATAKHAALGGAHVIIASRSEKKRIHNGSRA